MTTQVAQTPILDSASVPNASARKSLLGLSSAELEGLITAAGLPKFRARQLWRWVWRHGLTNFDEMTDLGKTVRAKFSRMFHADRPAVARRLQSCDGTIKWLLRFPDGIDVGDLLHQQSPASSGEAYTDQSSVYGSGEGSCWAWATAA